MTTSPREELLIKTVTYFSHQDGMWSWRHSAVDGLSLATSEEPLDSAEAAVADFFSQVGYDWTVVERDDTQAHFSKLLPGQGINFSIREYAYGAPEPFRGFARG